MRWACIFLLAWSLLRVNEDLAAAKQRIEKLEERCMPPTVEPDEKKEIGA